MMTSDKTKQTNDLTGIREYDAVNECFVMNDGSYMDIIKIRCHDLENSDPDIVTAECYALLKWIKTYPYEYEIVGLNFPVNTTEQQNAIEHIMGRTENPQHLYYLNQKYTELKVIDNKMIERQFYLFLFYENSDELRLQRNKTLIQLGQAALAETITRKQKELVLYKINNKNLQVSKKKMNSYEKPDYYNVSKEEKERNEKLGYDKRLMDSIGVAGGISFVNDDRFSLTGTGYEACLYVYDYPEKDLDVFWLAYLFNIDNAITCVHISPKNMLEVKKNIKKSLLEQESRVKMARDATEIRDAQQSYEENLETYEEIQALKEIILAVGARIYLAADTYEELDTVVAATIADLESDDFNCCIYLNEQEADWRAVYQPYSKQMKNVVCAKQGNPFKSMTLAFGNPFHFCCLMDPYGDYFGLTKSTNGPVIFDKYYKTKRRLSYNGFACGVMGSGKTTFLKKMEESDVIRGNFFRGFDVSGEWFDLVQEQGGKIIALDGAGGRINVLEVLKTSENEGTSYKMHISKCSLIYHYLKPSAVDEELLEFEKLLSWLYQDKGLLDEKGRPAQGKITGLPHEAYPTFSEFFAFLEKLLKEISFDGKGDAERRELEFTVDYWVKIKQCIGNVIDTYADIFDGYTTIENILETQVVIYDIRGLARMKETIFDAVMFSALSLGYDNLIQIGSIMKDGWEKWKGGDEEHGIHWLDITRFTIAVDEMHRIINARKLMALDLLLQYAREARKYFGGIWFATQSINDLFPDGSDGYGEEQLKKLFQLCQYKVIMHQGSETVPKLKSLFDGEIPEKELLDVRNFEQGECIMNISGDTNIHMKVFITDEEELLFKGGA